MPGPPCSICTHGAAQAIDSELVSGLPYRAIAKRHGVTISSLSRHRRDHLSPALTAVDLGTATGTGSGTDGHPETLLRQLYALLGRVRGILDRAEADGRPATALAAVREARQTLETVARISGALDERPVTNILNLTTSPEWLHVQATILRALEPYAEARWAVAAALDVDEDQVQELLP